MLRLFAFCHIKTNIRGVTQLFIEKLLIQKFAVKVGAGNERHLQKKSGRLPHLARLRAEDRGLTLESSFKKVFQLQLCSTPGLESKTEQWSGSAQSSNHI